MMCSYIILLPLISALFNGFNVNEIDNKKAGLIASSLMVIVTILSYIIFYKVAFLKQTYSYNLFNWFYSADFKANWSIHIDSLSAIMLIVVNTVSTLVHIYSMGYMAGEPKLARFYAYLSLFTFCMLMLVVSNNLLQLFFGWEGVGLCSYLLIGYWFKKESASAAAFKAFIVNRVADVFFALGIFATFLLFDTIEFAQIFANVEQFAEHSWQILNFKIHSLSLICFLLFIGCMGKSAQIGLHVWLPDAMEGPTPVSALIHAATMVTAGVFLLARCSYLFEYAPYVQSFIVVVGAVTCLFAATIAITQTDIKKIIAYSTCSQLGYMFFACGVSAYQAGIFHLFTHAFFKALLFLSAGSVIHALHHQQNIFKMGGIWQLIPKTYTVFWIGSLAIIGVFPLAGFYSKDLILESAYVANNKYADLAFNFGLLAAFFTAFYSLRLMLVVFHGKTNLTKAELAKIHESPNIMLWPLYILAIFSVLAGMFGVYALKINYISGYFADSIFVRTGNENLDKAHHVDLVIKLLPIIMGFFGMVLALFIYRMSDLPQILASKFKYFYQLSLNKYYIDEIYAVIFAKSFYVKSKIAACIDVKIFDKFLPNMAACVSLICGKLASRMQTGYIYSYVFVTIAGLIAIISFIIYQDLIKYVI